MTEVSKKSNENIYDTNLNLSSFRITKVLNNNVMKKLLVVQGKFKDTTDPAIIILEKKTFPNEEDSLQSKLFHDNTELEKIHHNDIYGKYECYPTKEYTGIATSIIYPATQKHIEKFTLKPSFIVEETAELYKTVTLPCIEAQHFSIQWVYNILERKSEAESIIYEDTDEETGFTMLPDLKWDGQLQSLNILILARKKIMSLRKLDSTHIPLLKNIKAKTSEILQQKYNVLPSQLRMYFHYQPSYYHLHIHVTHMMMELNSGFTTEKAHMLTTVINNLELMSDYYQRATLPFVVYKNDLLFKKYQELKMVPSDEELEKLEVTNK